MAQMIEFQMNETRCVKINGENEVQLTYQGFYSDDESPVKEALAAVDLVGATMLEKPVVLGYTPVGRVNPYQALLYKEMADVGIAVVPIVKSWNFERLAQIRHKASTFVLHIHWTSFVLNSITSYGEAKEKIVEFKRGIDSVVAKGGKIVWTLHNIIPHNGRFFDLEMEVQRYIAYKATVVHVLSAASLDMMSDYISFDHSKVLYAPHPNYLGTYEDYVTRENARFTLGLSADDRVYVLLGALKAYKGLNKLLEAFEQFCANDSAVPRKLIVGGMPDSDPDVTEFVNNCKMSANVLIEPKKIPANFVQYYMRAADVGLAAYDRMLNSGAILLYQTFDLPVITSNVPAIWENLTRDIAEMAIDNSVGELVAAFQRADRFINSDVRWRVRTHVGRFDASELSLNFGRELRGMLSV